MSSLLINGVKRFKYPSMTNAQREQPLTKFQREEQARLAKRFPTMHPEYDASEMLGPGEPDEMDT